MKSIKIIFVTLALFFITLNGFSQNTEVTPGYDYGHLESRTTSYGEVYYYHTTDFIAKDDKKMIGFKLNAYMTGYQKQYRKFGMITGETVNIGDKCTKGDVLTIRFENKKEIKLTCTSELKCKGEVYFFLDKEELELLKTIPMKKVTITDSETGISHTEKVRKEEKDYFIRIIYCFEHDIFVEIK